MSSLRSTILAAGLLTSVASSFASITYGSDAIGGATAVALGATETYTFTWHAVPTAASYASNVTAQSFFARANGGFTVTGPDNVPMVYSVSDASTVNAPLASSYDYTLSFTSTFDKAGVYQISFDGSLLTNFAYSFEFKINGVPYSQSTTSNESLRAPEFDTKTPISRFWRGRPYINQRLTHVIAEVL